jgi:hypothetical protein
MGKIGLAFRVFFRILSDAEFAQRTSLLLEAPPEPVKTASPSTPVTPKPQHAPAGRSEALNLLSLLQREARFVDFMKESLADYNDAQIGAAVRDVHRDSAAALERLFALRPIASQAEGAAVELPAGTDGGRYRLIGNVTQGSTRGMLAHHGWEATRCDLPEWTGPKDAAGVVAPAEIEVK